MRSILDAELTHDAFLGGKLHIWQPREGYRAGVDPVLLAASVPAKPGQSVLDLGCGAGAASLCLAARVPDLTLLGVEIQPLYAELALRNGLDCVLSDLAALPSELRQMSFDHVIANPPYFDRETGVAAKNAGRETALAEDTPLETWVDVAARRLRPKGYLHLIHRAERTPELLALVHARLGSLELKPLAARADRKAELVILRARKDGRAAFCLHAPLVLHAGAHHIEDGDDFAPDISNALRTGTALRW